MVDGGEGVVVVGNEAVYVVVLRVDGVTVVEVVVRIVGFVVTVVVFGLEEDVDWMLIVVCDVEEKDVIGVVEAGIIVWVVEFGDGVDVVVCCIWEVSAGVEVHDAAEMAAITRIMSNP